MSQLHKNVDTSLQPGRFWFNHIEQGSFEQRYVDKHGELVEDSVVRRYQRACGLPSNYRFTRELIAVRVSEDIAEALCIPPIDGAPAPAVEERPNFDLDESLAATFALLESIEQDFSYAQLGID